MVTNYVLTDHPLRQDLAKRARRRVQTYPVFSSFLCFREGSIGRADFSLFAGNEQTKFPEKMSRGLPAFAPDCGAPRTRIDAKISLKENDSQETFSSYPRTERVALPATHRACKCPVSK
jgi:hypothetical protein